jgi:hypothetical protein
MGWFRQALRKIGAALTGKPKLDYLNAVGKFTVEDLNDMAVQALRRAPSDLLFDKPTRANETLLKDQEGIRYSLSPEEQDTLNANEARIAKRASLNPNPKKPTFSQRLTDVSDFIEMKVFGNELRYINTIRRKLNEMLKGSTITFPELRKTLIRASHSQILHVQSVAGEAANRGRLELDKETQLWKAEYSKDSLPHIREMLTDISKNKGVPEVQVHKIFGDIAVALRINDIYKEADRVKYEASLKPVPQRAGYLKAHRGILELAKNMHMDRAEVATHLKTYNAHPEYKKPLDMWHNIREHGIDVLVKSGRYSKKQAQRYMDAAAYVPFNRIMDAKDSDLLLDMIANNDNFYSPMGSLSRGQKEYGIEGSKREVDDIVLNMEKWVFYSFVKAMKNHKAKEMIDIADDVLGSTLVNEVDGSDEGVVTVYRHGVKEYWKFEDPMMPIAFGGIPPVALNSFMKAGRWVSQNLRNSIVLMPFFTLSQLPQDTLTAMYTSGVKNPMKLPFGVLGEFGKTLVGKSKTHEKLKAYGIVGQKDFTDSFNKSIHDLSLGHKPLSDYKSENKLKLWLEHFAMTGDNAVRQAVYNQTLNENKGNPQAEMIATQRAFEIINFRHQGSSATLNTAMTITPFLRAYLAATRSALHTIAGRGVSPEEKLKSYAILASTSAQVMALTFIYNALIGAGDTDKEEKDKFKNRDIRERDTRVYPLRAMGIDSNVSLPIRPDVFALPFVFSNHIYNRFINKGTENPKETKEAIKIAVASALFNIPYGVSILKPLIEVGANYDTYTGKNIVPLQLQGLETELQYKEDTSELAKLLGKTGVISPLSVDHLIRGWTGYAGGVFLLTTDYALHKGLDMPYAEKSNIDMLRKFPGVSPLLGKDYSSKNVSRYYTLLSEMDKVSKSTNRINKNQGREKASEYAISKGNLYDLDTKESLNELKYIIDELNRQKTQILSMPNKDYSPAAKKQRIDLINERIRLNQEKASKIYDKVYK